MIIIFSITLYPRVNTHGYLVIMDSYDLMCEYGCFCIDFVLYKEASKGNIDNVKLLIKLGADPLKIKYFGTSPLVVAILNDYHLVAEYILNQCKINRENIEELYKYGNVILYVHKKTNIMKRIRIIDDYSFVKLEYMNFIKNLLA